MNEIMQMSALEKAAVGHGINLANTAVIAKFSSLKGFIQAPVSTRNDFIMKLGQAGVSMVTELGAYQVGTGFRLFNLYLGTITAGEGKLADEMQIKLMPLSESGDMPF